MFADNSNNPERKGDFFLGEITGHSLPSVWETQPGRGISFCGENYGSLFAAGERNPDRKGGLPGNCGSLLAAGARKPSRTKDLMCTNADDITVRIVKKEIHHSVINVRHTFSTYFQYIF